MQLPKELRFGNVPTPVSGRLGASMKCSSRKNYDPPAGLWGGPPGPSSMKCGSRRNCDLRRLPGWRSCSCLNEVQFPKELRPSSEQKETSDAGASMKCSSRRNCDQETLPGPVRQCHASMKCSSRRNCDRRPRRLHRRHRASMKCSSRRNCDNMFAEIFVR